jgi:hypothetical protein
MTATSPEFPSRVPDFLYTSGLEFPDSAPPALAESRYPAVFRPSRMVLAGSLPGLMQMIDWVIL